jgi:hypothetical protein
MSLSSLATTALDRPLILAGSAGDKQGTVAYPEQLH